MTIFQKINSTLPLAPYVGGKRNLAKEIIQRINSVSHASYVEPFCGMGGVFFRRDQKPKCEVINDLNGEVANFFRIVQRHYGPLQQMLKYSVSSRIEFGRLLQENPNTLTDLERAYRFIYLQKNCFGGCLISQQFAVQPGQNARFNSLKLEPLIELIHNRLANVVVENLSYKDCLERYDKPDTLFYMDPPYWNSENSYGKGMFDKKDFSCLADILSQIDGHVIFSINDVPEIRSLFGKFNIQDVDVTYTIDRAKPKRAAELIITNF